jgi:hypothetical protein
VISIAIFRSQSIKQEFTISGVLISTTEVSLVQYSLAISIHTTQDRKIYYLMLGLGGVDVVVGRMRDWLEGPDEVLVVKNDSQQKFR